MGDIIKQKSALFSNIVLDHKLYSLPCNPPELEDSADVAIFLAGLAKVNNLIITTEGATIFVQAPDIPVVKVLEAGELSEEFIESAKKFGWDILHLNGGYIVEYPRGHQIIFDKVEQSLVRPVSFEISVVSLSTDLLKEKGVSMQTALSLNQNLFDIVRDGITTQSDGLVLQAVAGITPKDFEEIFARSTVTLCSGLLGEEILVKVMQEYPYQLQGFDQLGKLSRQQVEVFEAGLSISLRPYSLGEAVRVKCDVQISNVDGINEFGYPNITRRNTTTSAVLDKDQSQVIAQLIINEDAISKKNSFKIFKRKSDSKTESTVLVTIKRID